jgi:hypothetical protein
MRTKRIDFWGRVGSYGNIVSPTHEAFESMVYGHFNNSVVRVTIQGVPKQIVATKRMFYRTQVIPMFLELLRNEGHPVDPSNKEHQEKANKFLSEEILGYEAPKENCIGQVIENHRNPYDLSDRDFETYLTDVIFWLQKIFKVSAQNWIQEAQKWQSY